MEIASLNRLLEYSNSSRMLCGRFLPDNNNVAFTDSTDIAITTVIDNICSSSSSSAKKTASTARMRTADQKNAVAFGAIQLCASNQAYLMFCECNPDYATKSYTVERLCNEASKIGNVRQQSLKISEAFEHDVDYSGLPQYFGAFEDRQRQNILVHVYDQLVKMSLKTTNMDSSKNVTVDLFENDEKVIDERQKHLFCDLMGFVVSDRFLFYEITIKKTNLHTIALSKRDVDEPEISYEVLSPETRHRCIDYDPTVTFLNRRKFLDFLLNINELTGLIALENGETVGYALTMNNRIVQCYANTAAIACELLVRLAEMMSDHSQISFFIRKCDRWICDELLVEAQLVRRIHRYHTRILPSLINWKHVFMMNIGAHLF